MKKTLTAIIASLALVGCTTISPRFEASYVPEMYRGESYNNLMYVSVGIDATKKIQDSEFYIGGNSGTYCDFSAELFPYVNPLLQYYDIYGGIRINSLDFFISHYCWHPVMSEPHAVWEIDPITGEKKGFWSNQGAETRIGVKYTLNF